MNRIFLYLFFIFSFDGFSQILPSQHALITTKKKSSSSPSDSWNTSNLGSNMVVSGNSVTSTVSGSSFTWNTAYGSQGISSGVKEWEVEISEFTNYASNTWDMIIGIASTTTNANSWFTNGCPNYGYVCQDGAANNGQATDCNQWQNSANYGEPFGENDVIKIRLDMDNGELRFYKNGSDQGKSHDIDTNQTYYLVVSFGNSNFTVTFDISG